MTAPLQPLTDYDREVLAHGVVLAERELAKRQAAEDRQQQASRDNAAVSELVAAVSDMHPLDMTPRIAAALVALGGKP